METQESSCPIPEHERTAATAKLLAEEFVKNFVDLTLPGEKSQENSKQ